MVEKNHLLILYVHNRPGVLSRISGIFGRLGCNIKSLCVAETLDSSISRITLVSRADSLFNEKIKKHLNKLVDVIEVQELDPLTSVERETSLVGVRVTDDTRQEIMRTVDVFGCRILHMTETYCILEVNGTRETTETVLAYLRPLGIEDLARTGTIALREETGEGVPR